MKTILVPVEQHDLIHNVLDASVVLANLFGSYIEGRAISVDMPDMPIIDITVGLPALWDPEFVREQANAARQIFETYFTSKGLPKVSDGAEALRWHWHDAGATTDSKLGAAGRCFDIILVGRPNYRDRNPRLTTFESALFESGRPVLVVPHEPVHSMNQHVMIAWNGSTETARTIALAYPLLKKAKRVSVLGIEGWGTSGPSAKDFGRMLELAGVPAQILMVAKSNEDYGSVVLRTAMELGCDLLIKGAYTQSRLRQMIFGGATNTILNETNIPVLFAH